MERYQSKRRSHHSSHAVSVEGTSDTVEALRRSHGDPEVGDPTCTARLDFFRACGIAGSNVILDSGATCSLAPLKTRPDELEGTTVKKLLNSCGNVSYRELGACTIAIHEGCFTHTFGFPHGTTDEDPVFEGKIWLGSDFLDRYGAIIDFERMDISPLSKTVLSRVNGPNVPMDRIPPRGSQEQPNVLVLPMNRRGEVFATIAGYRGPGFSAIMDSGGMFSTISGSFRDELQGLGLVRPITGPTVKMLLASHGSIPKTNWVSLRVTLGGRTRPHVFQVAEGHTRPMSFGCSLLYPYGGRMDFANHRLVLRFWEDLGPC